MKQIYNYKDTLVRVAGLEPDRVLLQSIENMAIAWADWSDFYELAEPVDDVKSVDDARNVTEWRVEPFEIEENYAYCVVRTLLATGNQYRQPNLEWFDGGRVYTFRAEAEETAEWLNMKGVRND